MVFVYTGGQMGASSDVCVQSLCQFLFLIALLKRLLALGRGDLCPTLGGIRHHTAGAKAKKFN